MTTLPIDADASDFKVAHLNGALSGYHYQNWRQDAVPTLMINPAADLHSLTAWCWGEAAEMAELTAGDCQFNAGMFYWRLTALAGVLRMIGSMTASQPKQEAQQ